LQKKEQNKKGKKKEDYVMKKYDYLIVGAGLFGAVFAHEAKEAGKTCLVIDKRNHIAGNIYTDKVKLEDYEFEKGGVDRVLVTAPPKTIGSACNVCNTGGIVSFLGISYNEPTVTFDSNVVHLNKLQIRGSNAIPALYFPLCIDLVKAGIVDVKSLVSHTFELDNLPAAMEQYYKDKATALKAVMVKK